MLYNFKQSITSKHKKTLCDFLDEQNYVQVTGVKFQVIRRDLGREESLNNIIYKDDGIYLTVNGFDYKGYIYLKRKVQVEKWGPPAYHIRKCQKLQAEIEVGGVHDRYYWHNSNVVDIISVPSGTIHKNLVLRICGYCSHYSNTSDTQEFYEELQENGHLNEEQEIEVDLFGYVKEWQKISQIYKRQNNYTCEKCKIQMKGIDQRYIHTDHINGDKTRNEVSNFECLCILCHCYKDELHRQNFGRRRMKRELVSFVNKYKSELYRLNNQYLKLYDEDNK